MSAEARENILARLKKSAEKIDSAPETVCLPVQSATSAEKIAQLKRLLAAVRSEVYLVDRDRWTDTLKEVLIKRDVKTLLYAPQASIGPSIERAWQADGGKDLPALCLYEGKIETFKEKLFQIDAAVTTSVGAIAESGAVVLWPNQNEPRLMSLVPPIHIVVLEAGKIYNTFCEMIEMQDWIRNMPTNVVLISGPSRTADIEMTVAFGVHGPKELIVLIVTNE
jgi:L-lactate dehydrogenase complex protein LldG